MNLAIIKEKNKMIHLPKINFSEAICRLDLRNEKKKIDLKREEKTYHGSNFTLLSNESRTTLVNKNNSLNVTNFYISRFQNTTEDIEFLHLYFTNHNDTLHKENVCSRCLNSTLTLQKIIEEISLIEADIVLLNNTIFTKQEYILKFSGYINNINFIKIELYKLRYIPIILQEIDCPQYKKETENFHLALRRTNLLIEVIQDSIRKPNLNVNFIVLS